MKRIFGLSLCALCLGTTVWAGDYVLTSPGKTLKVNINVGNTVSYSVFHQDKMLMKNNELALELENKVLGEDAAVKRVSQNHRKERIPAFYYRCADFDTEYNEMKISFKGGYSLIFRAYNEGIAYRWDTDFKDSILVRNEKAEFNFPENYKAYLPYTTNPKGDQYAMAFQNIYTLTSLGEAYGGQNEKYRIDYVRMMSE